MHRQRLSPRQIALYFILFYSVGTVLLGLGAYWLSVNALSRQLDNRIFAETQLLAHIQKESGSVELRAALGRRDGRGVNNLGYLLFDQTGKQLGGELGVRQPMPGWRDIQFPDKDGEASDARALTTRLGDGSILTVAAETAPTRDLRDTFLALFLPGLAIMLVGGIAGGLLLGRAIRNRIEAMNDTAIAIIAGDMDQRIAVSREGDEFARLATTLNRMLDRNSALIDNLRQVSSDIAHDLRTPIAHLRQRLERAIRLVPPHEILHREIDGAIVQSNAILSLFAALLRISEVESGALHRYFKSMDLSATVRTICESYVPAAEDSGHLLHYDLEDGIAVHGDAELMAQALVNLLENGLRHTPQGTAIAISLWRDADRILLSVDDNGSGVPDEHLASLTRRFTRLDKARSTPGYGLGLNLVSAIIHAHAGLLSFRSQGPGLGVRIELPGRENTAL